MRSLVLLLIMSLANPLLAATRRPASCEEILAANLTTAESFLLQVSHHVQNQHRLPHVTKATFRVMQLEGTLEDVLAGYGLTVEEWQALQDVEIPGSALLGTQDFLKNLKDVSPKQKKTFKTLNDAVDEIREKVKAYLYTHEEVFIKKNKRFLSEEELTEALRHFARDPKITLANLVTVSPGMTVLDEWRYRLLISREKVQNLFQKMVLDGFKRFVQASREIPETPTELYDVLAKHLQMTSAEVQKFFGVKGIFGSSQQMIDRAMAEHPNQYVGVVDRRVFTKARTERMLQAIREAENIIVFKLAENQDLGNFEEIEALARDLKAPILVSPAFSETGLIAHRLQFLFDHPNVHIQIDPILQLTKDFYIVNNGSPDKILNPMTGFEQIFQPTDRVIVYHPRVLTKTAASGYYDSFTGIQMTSGSMSIPAYRSEFNVGMTTDFRAQRAAELNRGLVVLSRQYQSEAIGNLVEGANGMAPRRISYAQPRYGNPAGLYDLGKIYSSAGVIHLKSLPAMVLGDIHLGVTDPMFQKALFKALIGLGVLKKNPKAGRPGEFDYVAGDVHLAALVLHDLVDGIPFNHWIQDKLVTKSKLDQQGLLDIENHFKFAAAFVNMLTRLLPQTKIIVPVDNHGHDWIKKTLDFGDLAAQQPRGLPIFLRLMLESIQNSINPYARMLQYFGIDPENVLFMSPSDQYRIGIDVLRPEQFSVVQGVEVGQHSQYGVNGAKSISLKMLLAAYGANMTGHRHSSAEDGLSKRVGTGTPPRQDYHTGPSTNDSSIATIYSAEAMQILRLERGSFLPNHTGQKPEEFFPNDAFPRLIPWPSPVEGGMATDQYRAKPPVARIRRTH